MAAVFKHGLFVGGPSLTESGGSRINTSLHFTVGDVEGSTFRHFGGLDLSAGDLDKKSRSDFPTKPDFLLETFCWGVSGVMKLLAVVCSADLALRNGEPLGTRVVKLSFSSPYCFSTTSWTYHTALEIGGRISFTAMAWILLSS